MENPATRDLTTRLSEIHIEIKDNVLEAQDQQKDNADKSQKTHPIIKIGNKIWLLHRNLKTTHLCDKFNFRRLRPFSVVKQINDVAFFITLLSSIKIHLIFHVFLLELYKESSIQGKFHVPPALVEIEGQEEFEVSVSLI